MQIGFSGYVSLATLIAVLGLWRKLSIMDFKFGLMWKDYCHRKGILANEFDSQDEQQ